MMEIFAKLQLQVLEEENSRLRAELLLCQEAAKQAFLRSANVLNSEAITMFQVRLCRAGVWSIRFLYFSFSNKIERHESLVERMEKKAVK